MNRNNILEFLDKATDAVNAAAPLATTLGIPFVEAIAGWVDTAVDVGKNVLERAEEGQIVLTSTDQADINARIAALEAVNAQLNAEIAAS